MTSRITFIAFVLIFGVSTQAHALLGPDISLGVRMGVSNFNGDESFEGVLGSGVELSSAPVVGIMAGVRQDHLGLELAVEWMESDLEEAAKVGELTTIPVLITGHYHILPKISPIDPYLGLGVGFYMNSFDPVSSVSEEVDPTVGFHVSAGVNAMISTALALTVDARLAFAETDLTIGNTKDELSLNTFLVTGGIKYFLPN